MSVVDQTPSLVALSHGVHALPISPFSRIISVAVEELKRVSSVSTSDCLTESQIGLIEEAIRRATARELAHLESWMGLLGTIGSTAPFIGLFGTVYGIMDAFLSIGTEQNATLAVVAPKIAEALIATAVGLVAAIPSVMAFNYFSRKIQLLGEQVEDFTFVLIAHAYVKVDT
ncbi:MotA/TolQ/ExbB proton channel family protein [Pajaroellobacter abortibovis]|nr:MotA/TolQ/ExbB proton channel family protein [Pajaroellobacter abortibovis]